MQRTWILDVNNEPQKVELIKRHKWGMGLVRIDGVEQRTGIYNSELEAREYARHESKILSQFESAKAKWRGEE